MKTYIYPHGIDRAESSMVEHMTAKNPEIEALINSMDVLKSQETGCFLQGKSGSLQVYYTAIFTH